MNRFIGVPYITNGRDPAVGLDCWGVVVVASKVLYGRDVPDYSLYRDSTDQKEIAPLFDARVNWQSIPKGRELPGDVIVVRIGGYPLHAGLCTGMGMMMHSLNGRNCCMESYERTMWRNRIEGFYRWAK